MTWATDLLPFRRLVNDRGVDQLISPENTSPDDAANSSIAGVPHTRQAHGTTSTTCFGSFVLVRFFDGSPYRREKRVAARGSVHFAR